MTYPQTRDEYRARIMADIFKLVQHIESDFNEYSTAETLARGLHFDVREYFNAERWKPTPVYDGLRDRVTLGTPLSLLIVHHGGHNGRQFVQGRIIDLHSQARPFDGAQFEIVPKGCRNPRRYSYRAGVGASITVYPGHVPETWLEQVRPLYHHAAEPPIQYDQASAATAAPP
ncbi:hypothetical protein [Deinococcus petrolearius]|uniref:Uncharacterized protein n=1 Tax=Deinococcus petrolearius TaxID=1751295 RepID=A0ABW1DRA2_9DEIO